MSPSVRSLVKYLRERAFPTPGFKHKGRRGTLADGGPASECMSSAGMMPIESKLPDVASIASNVVEGLLLAQSCHFCIDRDRGK